jgi:hypothetical protein
LLVYDQLSFPEYDLNRPCLDTEWLLSTLFDASLLSTSKPPETAALFLGVTHAVTREAAGNGGSFSGVCDSITRLETILRLCCDSRWTPGRKRAMIYSSYKPAPKLAGVISGVRR